LDEHPNAEDRFHLLERPATLWEDRYSNDRIQLPKGFWRIEWASVTE
jgi:hypothetical protein